VQENWRERPPYLVSCHRNNMPFVAIKVGRRQGGPSRTGGRGRIPLHFLYSWYSWSLGQQESGAGRAFRSRLEKQLTDLRRKTCYFGDRTLSLLPKSACRIQGLAIPHSGPCVERPGDEKCTQQLAHNQGRNKGLMALARIKYANK
jgi:hypothetical protein